MYFLFWALHFLIYQSPQFNHQDLKPSGFLSFFFSLATYCFVLHPALLFTNPVPPGTSHLPARSISSGHLWFSCFDWSAELLGSSLLSTFYVHVHLDSNALPFVGFPSRPLNLVSIGFFCFQEKRKDYLFISNWGLRHTKFGIQALPAGYSFGVVRGRIF